MRHFKSQPQLPNVNEYKTNYRQQEHPKSQDKSPKSVKQLLNINNVENVEMKKDRQVTAYRQLFEDDNDAGNEFSLARDQEELTGQKSPQFKNI